ncbi:hypothetical protein TrispH2_010918 [Trichoplax sp. H2]|nr:hypothetical protein TrispH2_010918 [Trichoplax sp. H2]|eukprot:RDD36863.1 hypothetical protein TrispH2_010918 [Trichoplax sp. H2]
MGVSFFKRKNSFPNRMNQIKRQVSLFKKEADQLAFFKKEAPTPGFALFKKEAPTPGFALFKKQVALFKKQVPLFKKQAPTSGFALFKKQVSFFRNEDAYNKKADKLTNPKVDRAGMAAPDKIEYINEP